jgi:hypothetical protein
MLKQIAPLIFEKGHEILSRIYGKGFWQSINSKHSKRSDSFAKQLPFITHEFAIPRII